jgi:hypothetical protein
MLSFKNDYFIGLQMDSREWMELRLFGGLFLDENLIDCLRYD